jgi:hypothetical protein
MVASPPPTSMLAENSYYSRTRHAEAESVARSPRYFRKYIASDGSFQNRSLLWTKKTIRHCGALAQRETMGCPNETRGI